MIVREPLKIYGNWNTKRKIAETENHANNYAETQ